MAAINKGIDEEIFNSILEVNKSTSYHRLIDMNITELGMGQSIMEVKITDKHLNPLGIAHGGVLFSIMDTAMGMAARTLGKNIVTLEMNINFIKPVMNNDTIKAIGKVVHTGKSTTIAVCDAYNQEGKLAATARETFYNIK
ncbi:PaaI family thioesterase [Thermoanaerobacterium sp. RBIITD]|uniref:PaaI family thioesterase n=1 Tax=Thermoanaerobacterium sp. RBIITD TaxID=1550240 RepID=UPI000BB85546|nr:PaaI family thioesterase [Thermoanaerobacterium sp. RBIITD]SNX54712.1 acyl-CoA thioesterase [Thermoanaerobacterium sp. RBIITD]